ncbi:phosphatase PAP2 family protein [Ursidibacter maritimus]|uniref:undecaprenyl-diphosphate phosphatase n=1 Tax=Ursidibacter maritimus TaxID=1331689 RepID=A0A949WFH2_9PAST|nr:phosphatase PAP2 family protein [Ursidibacter maritimus]MBV6524237.1 phosphatase PAP2 family protein [Ursidibacter maritimus]MBV6525618.1 phosphatase PAP2 family protein [Ursidibacter maritimus]MBV6528107.1 phosphatase PAP2 family protein [Ursidibacter maritimus]MBV6528927.1 phosphatase PAP2 family protein [Ursidibacter maritimus]MBV6530946.1 phosphatase PAP2 family protein [Ursidibacter maritimus]
MLIIPLATWAIEWQWALDTNLQAADLDFGLFILTETGSTPYALITCVLFMLWLMWLTRKRYSWFLVGFICASSVVGTQIIKEGAKAVFKEPRPFVTQMFQAETERFYSLPKLDQEKQVLTFSQPNIQFVTEHQADELGYSFPSGHTIFAVSWLLVFAGFLFGLSGQAVIFAQIFAILWAGLMLISRLRLGMHYPIDLFVSTLISWLFHLIVFVWVIPYLSQWQWFRKRG